MFETPQVSLVHTWGGCYQTSVFRAPPADSKPGRNKTKCPALFKCPCPRVCSCMMFLLLCLRIPHRRSSNKHGETPAKFQIPRNQAGYNVFVYSSAWGFYIGGHRTKTWRNARQFSNPQVPSMAAVYFPQRSHESRFFEHFGTHWCPRGINLVTCWRLWPHLWQP